MTASNAPGFLENSIASPGTAAMMLALTQTIYDEELAKKLVAKKGLKAVVTEVGGKTSFYDFNERINRAVIGACLNSGLIEKKSNDIHAVIHATEEAKRGLSVSTSSSLAMKIAIVRNEHWIAVALFGKSALHYMTNHERAGLGVMHI